MAQKPTAKKPVAEDPRYTAAIKSYEDGLRAMQEHKFDKAKPHFQKVITGPSKELTDRASVHLNTCNHQLERSTANQFKSPEEHYDYAVSLMNVGDYVTAREHLEKLHKQAPKADYVIYGIAALDCLTGHVEDALRRLDESLKLNPQLRYQARNDSDFHNLAEDPRFTELLYPDPGADLDSPDAARLTAGTSRHSSLLTADRTPLPVGGVLFLLRGPSPLLIRIPFRRVAGPLRFAIAPVRNCFLLDTWLRLLPADCSALGIFCPTPLADLTRLSALDALRFLRIAPHSTPCARAGHGSPRATNCSVFSTQNSVPCTDCSVLDT